jgi:hypothetical protein
VCVIFTPIEKIIEDIPLRRLQSQVSDHHLAEIAQDLVDWEQISPALKLTDSECREIKEDFSDRYNLQKRQALRVWRWKSGEQATYKNLIQLLYSQGLVQVAETLANSLRTGKQRLGNSVILDTFHRYLLDCYHELCHPSRKQWPSYFQDFLPQPVYVDLTLSTISLNSTAEIVLAGKEISSNEIITNLSDVFSSGDQLMVLFEGVAGSGKTTLSWHACREWANKKLLQQFHLLIHIQMKNPQLHEAKHLPDLIPYPDKKLRQEVATAIADQKGKGVCFLLDGLDEAPTPFLELLFEILCGTYVRLPQLSLIMTSRPDSRMTTKLRAILKSKITIEGFSKAKLYEFLDVSLGANSNEKQQLIQKFKINPQLESLCGLPINAVIMMYLNHFFPHGHRDDIPITQTSLFKPLLSNFLVRHVETRTDAYELPEIEDFTKDIPPIIQKAFWQICKLAYTDCTSSMKKKLFTSDELLGAKVSIDNSLGLLQIHPKITMFGHKRYYSFPHLSLQEFLAAVHISSWKKQSKQTRAIKDVMKQDPLSRILPFYAGLTHLHDNQEALQVLSEVLKLPVEDRITLEALKENLSLANDRRRQALTLFNCLYESQDAKLFECQEVQLASDKLSLLGLGLTPTDCIAVAYFIRKSLLKMQALIHRMGRCSEIGISSFVKEIRRGVCTSTSPDLGLWLEISDVIFTKEAIQSLKELLQGQSILKALHMLCYLDPTNASVTILLTYLIEGLSFNSSCNQVMFGFFDLHDSHVYHLILLVRGCPQLKVFSLDLSLSVFDLSRRIMPLLSAALRYTTLRVLGLTGCKIDDRALQYLGSGIHENQHLEILVLSKNSFTVKGLLSFLILFINDKSILEEVKVNGELRYPLMRTTGYSYVISQIERVRHIFFKKTFSVTFAEIESTSTTMKYLQSAGAQVVELPAAFSRRDVL